MRYTDIKIDFLPLYENLDPRVLSIFDVSHWQHIEEDKYAKVIDITVPNSNKPIRNYYKKNAINNFNSVNLNINCKTSNCTEVELIDLPDGLYEITVTADGGFTQTKKYFRTVLLELEFDKILLNFNIECEDTTKENKDNFLNFLLYLKNIEAHTRYDNICAAQSYYEMCQKLINKFKKCKNCF